ncbi:hypothetical protein CLAFUW4_07990 [Fulvia fulva]|uniref:Uncharacterized protein n=1 Tax=Passalora fulva TaxID=5499 RepID=A0A9Q8LCP7_PASFU|nr:uncharacterized protein CLAFUR5_08111 [Fulvia fulva]KAK4629369.1 hypothetical protein CLAFUR4_07995 [Fulvia fulva]KAK4630344.1 hypothetical protein CLAFUR0_07991 [Fulvia fulva]UJO15065.1 hypothetical protein CLAFUR5_08111 [Fulvia fulva]WPV12127.1 hypothetical protein CLAFUW4_07990 [Fulvia fulva]WPV27465.1 hypothetical protein CLAFUW7_07990 [Fulvia fulva]
MSLQHTLRNTLRTASSRTHQAGARTITSTRSWQSKKDETQDYGIESKDSLNPVYDEYSRSGSDQAAGQMDQTAYGCGNNDPDAQHRQAREESKKQGKDSNPLEFSPANTDFGHQKAWASKEHGGPDRAAPKETLSGRGSGQKGGAGRRYRDPEKLIEETKKQKRDADTAI